MRFILYKNSISFFIFRYLDHEIYKDILDAINHECTKNELFSIRELDYLSKESYNKICGYLFSKIIISYKEDIFKAIEKTNNKIEENFTDQNKGLEFLSNLVDAHDYKIVKMEVDSLCGVLIQLLEINAIAFKQELQKTEEATYFATIELKNKAKEAIKKKIAYTSSAINELQEKIKNKSL